MVPADLRLPHYTHLLVCQFTHILACMPQNNLPLFSLYIQGITSVAVFSLDLKNNMLSNKIAKKMSLRSNTSEILSDNSQSSLINSVAKIVVTDPSGHIKPASDSF